MTTAMDVFRHLPQPAIEVPSRSRDAAIAYAAIFGLAVALAFRFTLGTAPLNDSLSIYWVWADQFTAELAKGVLYPRWLPQSDAGLGTPVFYYYPPLSFYLAGLFGLLGLSTYASLIAVFTAAFAGSGLACWYWLRDRSNHPLLGALFFMAAPYHLLNYADRGAVAESVATAFLPILAIGLRRIAERRRGIVFTAVSYAALILAHLPLALLVSLFLMAPYALVHRDRLRQFAVAYVLGLALAAIYLVPALALDHYHDSAELYRQPILRPAYWSIFSGNWTDPNFTFVIATVAAIIIAAAPSAVARRDRWGIHAIAVAVVVSGAVPLLWSLPILRDVQCPFRALPIAEFALATALARLPSHRGKALIPAALPLLLSMIAIHGFHPPRTDLQRLRTQHPDAYEYLPKGVVRPGHTTVRLRDLLDSRIPPPRVPGMVVEPRFYFPAWSCAVEEPRTQLLMHRPDCRPRLVWTLAEKLGAAISAAAGLLLLLLLVARRRKRPARRELPITPGAAIQQE